MDWLIYGGIFALSGGIMYLSGEWVVAGVTRLARALEIREFVVAFFFMAAAASLPNLFVGLTAALGGTPELSLGDIFGNNLIALTLAVAVAAFLSPAGNIEARGKIIQHTALFTMAAAILPIALLLDGALTRIDGLILIAFFLYYVDWLLDHKQESHHPTPLGHHSPANRRLWVLLRDAGLAIAGVALIIAAALGLVLAARFFAGELGVSLTLIGLLVVGFGNALPEVYFAALSARRGDTGLILGNLMGSVIFPATLVLGIIALIHPIAAEHLTALFPSRLGLIAAALLFYLFARTRQKISRGEALILLLIYLAVVVVAVTVA